MTNYNDFIISIVSVILPVLGGFITNVVTKYIKNKTLFTSILQLAKDGVVLAEKSGAITYLTSAAKFKQAEAYVIAELKKIGFKDVSEDLIKAEIEKAYTSLKTEIESAYDAKEQPKLADSVSVNSDGDTVVATTTTSK